MAVVEYLGRYTHKVAISNHRIKSLDKAGVTFTYKDYRSANQQRTLTLGHGEFIRRFALHILPRGFVRIRHYGILSSSSKFRNLPIIRAQLPEKYAAPDPVRILSEFKQGHCLHCKTATMVTVETLPKRAPPSLLAIGLKHIENQCKTK